MAGPRSSAWPWLLLALALAATVLLRAPLILNARAHLDSDLAVDGLTLREALDGHWRWHYPGTPHVGTASLIVMLPVGLVAGATPEGLAISGSILWILCVVAIFALTLRVFGRRVAAWSLLPLAFSSTGTIWLSGRITGGHLLAVAWHAAAFLLLFEVLKNGGIRRAALLGFWCGLGLWNDSMSLMTLAGLIPAGLAARLLVGSAVRTSSPRATTSERGPHGGPYEDSAGLWAIVGPRPSSWPSSSGLLPKFVGRWADPYDAYREQFAPIWRADVLLGHVRILGLDCLPRLIAGHRLPNLEAEPGGIGPDGRPLAGSGGVGVVSIAVVSLGLGLFLVALPGLGLRADATSPTRAALTDGLSGGDC